MPVYAEISVNVPQVSGVFHYHVPDEMHGSVAAGSLVTVPFGKQTVQGIVLRFVDTPAVDETRPILEILDAQPVVTPSQIALASTMADETLAPLAAWMALMLPPELGQQADILVSWDGAPVTTQAEPIQDTLIDSSEEASLELSATQRRLIELLKQRGPLRGRQIDQALSRADWRSASRNLTRRGLITTRPILSPPTVHPKIARTAQLACPPEGVKAAMPTLARANAPDALARRQTILRFLLRETQPVPVDSIYAESGANLKDLQVLAERGLISLGETEVIRDPLADLEYVATQPPPLTRDQLTAWSDLQEQLHLAATGQTPRPILLFGVTGSGKTEMYLYAVAETLRLGRQAIILVPEIALTPQTTRRFVARFPGQVGLLHSRLSTGERFDTWRRARAGELGLVVGPRSALFTPFPNLGLIVVDEFHDDSYYQGDLPPFYHARNVAIRYAQLSGAVCLLGSATPDMDSAYRAARGEWQILRLPARLLAHQEAVRTQLARLAAARQISIEPPEARAPESSSPPYPGEFHLLEGLAETRDLPPVHVVDMRQELKDGNRSIFSQRLQNALEQVFADKQQAILFLNRRGSATFVFCRDCGYSLKCPRCETPLTYHQMAPHPEPVLVCHYCNYQRKPPRACPSCRGNHIRQFGTGTERVESEILSMFPNLRTLRWDAETTRHKGAHETIMAQFSAHRADVLIGTQMLAKGLDLPLVTLVGVVLADVGLNLPDYRAAERTFQVLTQVAGRAGRSLLGGQVVLQTFQPDHYAIQAAASHDFRAFYQKEMEYRRRLGYPPYTQLVRLEYRHQYFNKAEMAAQSLASQIRQWIEAEDRRATQMIGPTPCFFSRIAGWYRWQIILRGPNPVSLLRGRQINDWRIEENPQNLL